MVGFTAGCCSKDNNGGWAQNVGGRFGRKVCENSCGCDEEAVVPFSSWFVKMFGGDVCFVRIKRYFSATMTAYVFAIYVRDSL